MWSRMEAQRHDDDGFGGLFGGIPAHENKYSVMDWIVTAQCE